ncbi:MAG: A/G-specific adenine glycosylase [Gemmatimonadales bacterium]|nr:A/G-specific adenine glycosylase [Gemmatimonadales bacterium]
MPRKSRADRKLQASEFRRRLLRWFRRHGRDLPWRRTRDPYHIVVSEFMLQQTQVSRVEAYYDRFLKRYPSIEALAAAPAATVRESWEGLGYYRRAANLHRLAQVVVGEHGGVVPADPAALMRLPGVGRYTAGAVACFAYQRATPAVDTNVARVIQRAFHPRLRGIAVARRVWKTAATIVPRKGNAAWGFNQAIMELGALVCTARVARCGECPVRAACLTGRRTAIGAARGVLAPSLRSG